MKPRIIDIQEAVCIYYDIPMVHMREDVREARTAHARQMAMYLARTLTGHSYPAIGRMFGGKDHSTVIHAVRQVKRRLEEANDAVTAWRAITDDLTERRAAKAAADMPYWGA